jgi:holo-[acyl-carrier protein] synthase
MDLIGVGTAIVEVLRIGRMIERHGELFLARVYTDREIRFCQKRKHSAVHFARLWAAKEAVLMALEMKSRRDLVWNDTEIRVDARGKSRVLLCGAAKEQAKRLRVADVRLAIAHCRGYATAYALALRASLERPSV